MANQLNEILDSLTKIKALIRSDDQQTTPTHTNERVGVLELALDELRIIYSRLDTAYDQVKLRILTFLGAGLALLSYLYSTKGDLFIPAERYGRVLYFIGLGLVISSVSLLLHAVRGIPWSVPIESSMGKMLRKKNKEELLESLVEEYIESMEGNIGKYEKKTSYLKSAFMQLLCGAILLLVIKNIGR